MKGRSWDFSQYCIQWVSIYCAEDTRTRVYKLINKQIYQKNTTYTFTCVDSFTLFATSLHDVIQTSSALIATLKRNTRIRTQANTSGRGHAVLKSRSVSFLFFPSAIENSFLLHTMLVRPREWLITFQYYCVHVPERPGVCTSAAQTFNATGDSSARTEV